MKHENIGQINLALMYESDGRLIEPDRTKALKNARDESNRKKEFLFRINRKNKIRKNNQRPLARMQIWMLTTEILTQIWKM